MKIAIIVTLVLLIVISIGCNKSMLKGGGIDNSFEVAYSRSKGKSKSKPQYDISLKGNKVTYNGTANMDVMGEQTFEISKAQFKTIQSAFEDSNFTKFEELYRGKKRDLPMMRLSYKGREIRFQEQEAPENLKGLAALLMDLVPKG